METHLIVLWEKARSQEAKILADIKEKLEIVATGLLSWPGDAERCFGEFYGANLLEAKGKVIECGEGAFRYVIVRDAKPVYAYEDTSRGLEKVNSNLFALKNLYRSWTGGGHKVHTTNTYEEFRRDIKLLTNHAAEEWENGRPEGEIVVLPGHGGWKSLRELFAFLDSLMPYVVLRNAETLPDGFDPSLHGDIDLLVPDAVQCASILGARKVFPEDYRVHYEVEVAGKPVRFDFRYVGDDYYDRSWEEKMLSDRRRVNGVNLLAPEDAFYALVYHALYQKKTIAVDYHAKAAALAEAAGIGGCDFDDWQLKLEEFLAKRGYETLRCVDKTVLFNEDNVYWRKVADKISRCGPFTELRPYRVESVCAQTLLENRFFRGKFDGEPCFVKYSPIAGNFAREEWRVPKKLIENGFGFAAKPLYWHKLTGGGSIVAMEFVEGETLERMLLRGAIDEKTSDRLADEIVALAEELKKSGFVHRDVRPSNLVIQKDGSIKLIDFQFAVGLCDEEPLHRDPVFANSLTSLFTLYALGEDYAFARAQWNDAYSCRKCLDLLAQTPRVREAKARLEPLAQHPDRTGLGSERLREHYLRRLNRLSRHRLLAKFGIRKRRYKEKDASDYHLIRKLLSCWPKTLESSKMPSSAPAAEPPLVSVIVPCYNQGMYLKECLDSVFAQDYPAIEVVVVDDGSTNPQSLKALDAISDPRVTIIRKRNEGVAIARNTAIASSRGKYLLPIDADDKIGPGFVSKAVAILEKDAEVGVVGCETARFGAESGPFPLPAFDPKLMLMANVVVCTAVYRRADWDLVGGYRANMVYGWEDWDFWLSLIELKRKFVRLPQALFFYRSHGVTRNDAMKPGSEKAMAMLRQLVENHAELYARHPTYRAFLLENRRSRRHLAAKWLAKRLRWMLPAKWQSALDFRIWKIA